MKKRVFYIGLLLINVANAQDTQVPQPPPVVEAPMPKDVLNVAVKKPILNTSDVLSIKDATNARSEYGTMPPVKFEAGPDKFELPVIEVLGAEAPVELGNLVELSIKPIDKLPAGLKSVIYCWTILPPPPRVIPWVDSSKIIFGTGIKSQEYTIILTATYAFINDELKLLEHRTDEVLQKEKKARVELKAAQEKAYLSPELGLAATPSTAAHCRATRRFCSAFPVCRHSSNTAN